MWLKPTALRRKIDNLWSTFKTKGWRKPSLCMMSMDIHWNTHGHWMNADRKSKEKLRLTCSDLLFVTTAPYRNIFVYEYTEWRQHLNVKIERFCLSLLSQHSQSFIWVKLMSFISRNTKYKTFFTAGLKLGLWDNFHCVRHQNKQIAFVCGEKYACNDTEITTNRNNYTWEQDKCVRPIKVTQQIHIFSIYRKNST